MVLRISAASWPVVPVLARRASKSVVLPLAWGPMSAIQRGLLPFAFPFSPIAIFLKRNVFFGPRAAAGGEYPIVARRGKLGKYKRRKRREHLLRLSVIQV